MKYLLMIYMNDSIWETLSEDERNAVFAGHDALIKLLHDRGEFVHTAALSNPTQTRTVRVRDGVTAATDGPYIEAKEFLGGYYLIDVADRERALELAGQIPDASIEGMGVEVRPIMFSTGALDV